jgi:hypothetical protein
LCFPLATAALQERISMIGKFRAMARAPLFSALRTSSGEAGPSLIAAAAFTSLCRKGREAL